MQRVRLGLSNGRFEGLNGHKRLIPHRSFGFDSADQAPGSLHPHIDRGP
jgi:transposase